jgi:serine/threonine protein phosphatase PrpC
MSKVIRDFNEKNIENILITNNGYSKPIRSNEDWCNKFIFNINNIDFTLLLVIDGHGCPNRAFNGSILNNVVIDISKYFSLSLYENILDKVVSLTNFEDSIVETHLKMQKYFNKFEDLGYIGACLGGALIFNDICISFNLGDISVIHIDNDGEYRLLSDYHNTKNIEEYNRLKEYSDIKILDSGNILHKGGKISVSGSLGNNELSFMNRIPHIFSINLSKNDKIIVTSDGIIGSNNYGLSVEMLVDIVKNTNDYSNIEQIIATQAFININKKGISPSNTDDATIIFYEYK